MYFDYLLCFSIASVMRSSPVLMMLRGIARFRRTYPSALPTNKSLPPSSKTPALFAKNPGRSATSGRQPCSMQVQSFRKVHGLPYASTMCTGNLRSGTELLFRFVQSGDKELRYKSLHYYGVIFFFILGAGCGALVTQHFGSTTIVYCNILLLLTCALLSIEHVEE